MDAFIDQERKFGDRRRSDNVVVLTTDNADLGLAGALFDDSVSIVMETEVFGFWGEYGCKAGTYRN